MNRIEWIDIAKGLGIVLVVIGHVVTTDMVHDTIFLFHMPLFFLLSGMVFKTNEAWLPCMKKKFLHLMVPYLFFMVMFVPLRMATDAAISGTWPSFRLGMLGMSYFDKPLWFVFALFGVIAIMRTLFTMVKYKWLIALITTVLGGVGYVLLLRKMELPLHVSRALFVLPFFALGIWMKKHTTSHNVLELSIGLLGISFGIFELLGGTQTLDTLKMQVDGNPLFVYLSAIGGSLLVIQTSKQLERLKPLMGGGNCFVNAISYVGRNSFYIFAVHHPFILFCNSLAFGALMEPSFHPLYALWLVVGSIIASIAIGTVLKKLAPQIFR